MQTHLAELEGSEVHEYLPARIYSSLAYSLPIAKTEVAITRLLGVPKTSDTTHGECGHCLPAVMPAAVECISHASFLSTD